MVSGLGHASSYKPGDVVRSKSDGTDYVIQTISSSAIGGGALIYCLSLYGQNLRQFKASELDDLLKIKSNITAMTPSEVKIRFHEGIEKIFRSNQELIQKIHQPENKILKDLIFIGIESDELNFDKTLVEIARGLVYNGQGVPTLKSIKDTLSNSTKNSSVDQEFIEDLSNRIYKESITQERFRVGQGSTRFLTHKQSDFVKDFLSSKNEGLQPSDEAFLRTARTSLQEEAKRINTKIVGGSLNLNDQEKSVLDLLIGDSVEMRRHLVGTHLEDVRFNSPQHRLQKTLQTLFQSGETIYNNRGKEILKAYREGKKNEVIQAILESKHPDIIKTYSVIRNAQMLDIGDRRGHHSELMFQRNRRTALGSVLDISTMRGEVDLHKLSKLADFSDNKSTIISIDMPTLFDEVFSDLKLNYKGKSVDLNDGDQLASLKKLLNLQDKVQAYTTPSNIKEILEAKKNGTRYNVEKFVNLSNSIREQVGQKANIIAETSHGIRTQSGFAYNRSRITTASIPGSLQKRMRSTKSISSIIKGAALSEIDSNKERLFIARSNATQLSVFDEELQSTSFASTNLNSLLKKIQEYDIDNNLAKIELSGSSKDLSVQYVDVDSSVISKYNKTKIIEDEDLLSFTTRSKPLFDPKSEIFKDLNLRTLEGLQEAAVRQGGISKKNSAQTIKYQGFTYKTDKVAAYEQARSNTRIALTRVKDKNGDVFRLMGTEMPHSLEEQIRRASKFYEGRNVGILDIETMNLTGSDTKILKEITLGVKNVSGIHTPINYNQISSNSERADILIRLADSLKSVDIVGTHSASDFVEIQRMLISLINSNSNPDIIRKLKKAQQTISKVAKTKLFDLQTIYQVAGEKLGSTSQEALSAIHIGNIQEHTSFQDVMDAFKLTEHTKNSFDSNLKNLSVIREDILEEAPILFDTNPMSNMYGRLMKPVHIGTSYGNKKVNAIYQEFEVGADNLPTQTGNYFTENADSVYQLGARFNSREVFDSQHFELYNHTIDESAQRTFRSYTNPLGRSYWDELGSHNPIIDGPFSATQLLVDNKSRGLFPHIESEINKLAKPADFHEYKSRTEKINNIIDKFVTTEEHGELSERLKHQLFKMSTNINERDKLMGQSRYSVISEFHNSSLGQFLIDAAKQDKQNDLSKNFTFLTELVMGRASQLHDQLISQGLEGLTDIKEYGPRISLKLLGQASTKRLNDIKDFSNIEVSANELSGKILASFKDEAGEGPIHSVIERLGFDPHLIKDTMKEYGEEKNLTDNLWEWKQAVNDISFLEDSDKFAILKQVKHGISNSEEMSQTINQAILKNAHKEGESYAEQLIEQANKVVADYGIPHKKAISQVMLQEFKYNPDKLKKLFTDSQEQLSAHKLIQVMTEQELKGIKEVNENIQKHLESQSGYIAEVQSVLSQTKLARDVAYQEGKTGLQLQSAGGLSLLQYNTEISRRYVEMTPKTATDTEILHTLTQEAGGAVSEVLDSRMTTAIQHELLMTKNFNANINPINDLAIPLLAVGGVLGLIGASHRVKDHFSQGRVSDKKGDSISLSSEIPGKPDGMKIWHGEEMPFKLDISFQGFVRDKKEHDQLMSQVYDSLQGDVVFKKVSNKVIDKRNQGKSTSLRDII